MQRKIYLETPRLLIGEIIKEDAVPMFEMDADPLVHQYLADKILSEVKESEQIIASIRRQYKAYGIGRWAIVEKSTQEFLGWTGFKFCKQPVNNHSNFYDIGYRLLRKYWNKGYATESVKGCLDYAFSKNLFNVVYADVESEHKASKSVLEKAGLNCIETFIDDGYKIDWYRITKDEWEKNKK